MIKPLLTATLLTAASLTLTPAAQADTPQCFSAEWQPIPCPVNEVSLSHVPWINQLPVCELEDCSDQPGQVGLWTSNEGIAYIEIGEDVTVRVVDDAR